MVEFALIAPIFIVLLFSIIEFGRAVYHIQMLNHAAREGARYAIVHGSESMCPSGPMPAGKESDACDPTGANVVAATKNAAIAVLDSSPTDFQVHVRWCDQSGGIGDCPGTIGDGTNARNEAVHVEVAYTFRPFLAGVVPLPTFNLSGGSTLVVNH
jgi:hypothetical protein